MHALATIMPGNAALPDASLPGRFVRRDGILFAALTTDEPVPYVTIERGGAWQASQVKRVLDRSAS